MKYALLIYTPEPTEPPDPALIATQTAEYDAVSNGLRERGAFEAGEALHPTSAATTVRVRDGQVVTTDGPFAETKEALGGFYLIEAADLDEAIAWAAKLPGARHGSVEVRPIWEFSADPAAGALEAASAN